MEKKLERSMPTYHDYLQYAKAKGFIPFTEKTFNAFIKAKINPITSTLIGD